MLTYRSVTVKAANAPSRPVQTQRHGKSRIRAFESRVPEKPSSSLVRARKFPWVSTGFNKLHRQGMGQPQSWASGLNLCVKHKVRELFGVRPKPGVNHPHCADRQGPRSRCGGSDLAWTWHQRSRDHAGQQQHRNGKWTRLWLPKIVDEIGYFGAVAGGARQA